MSSPGGPLNSAAKPCVGAMSTISWQGVNEPSLPVLKIHSTAGYPLTVTGFARLSVLVTSGTGRVCG
ncbi:hypothetical protein SAMN04489730_6531 [Amycolatopsis australiensis]|uniref:Uncharacterized protein n=2 Tax=Amycolatopsis australiensis TaxID=546364 RepID=A0A1K1SS32_9PSEU|nr:hypothetical protein SAMN04489730_6531 [Amycolatopsis australiensis]